MQKEAVLLKEEGAEGSKQQRSNNMQLGQEEHQKQINIGSELTSLSHKNEERTVSQQEIQYLVGQFLLGRNTAVNILRKMDLKQAVKYLVDS